MRLSSLLRAVGAVCPAGKDGDVSQVTRDTRDLAPDGVFVAVRGGKVDGHDLVADLRCAAVVVDRPIESASPVVVVADTRLALAALSAAWEGWPATSVPVVGVTGTNGKTTVTTLIQQVATAIGLRWGRIGTLGAFLGDACIPSVHTTPEAPELQRTLAWMRDGGAEGVALEVSSIGLAQRRVDSLPFHLAVFTNLTRDHLDFHGDMHAYRAAKARLFAELLRPAGGFPRALLCFDDPYWPQLSAPSDRWTYGFGAGADVHVRMTKHDAQGMVLVVRTPHGSADVRSPLVGLHNAQNVAAACGALLLCGVSIDTLAAGFVAASGAPGRLMPIANEVGVMVVVDYAHTEDALAHALRTLRPLVSGRLWVVFGCGGDRDRGKRPRMCAVACSLADIVVLTSDNPRSEDPEAILSDVLAGASGTVRVEADREAAIRMAIGELRAGDGVLVAGKGHETYQELSAGRIAFDDAAVCRAALAERA